MSTLKVDYLITGNKKPLQHIIEDKYILLWDDYKTVPEEELSNLMEFCQREIKRAAKHVADICNIEIIKTVATTSRAIRAPENGWKIPVLK